MTTKLVVQAFKNQLPVSIMMQAASYLCTSPCQSFQMSLGSSINYSKIMEGTVFALIVTLLPTIPLSFLGVNVKGSFNHTTPLRYLILADGSLFLLKFLSCRSEVHRHAQIPKKHSCGCGYGIAHRNSISTSPLLRFYLDLLMVVLSNTKKLSMFSPLN